MNILFYYVQCLVNGLEVIRDPVVFSYKNLFTFVYQSVPTVLRPSKEIERF